MRNGDGNGLDSVRHLLFQLELQVSLVRKVLKQVQ